MKVAIIGSRNVKDVDIESHVFGEITEVISGGASGVDFFAKEFAKKIGAKYLEILPRYERYGRGAPIKRNKEIVDYADLVVAFWNGESRGTKSTIEYCKKSGKICVVVFVEN